MILRLSLFVLFAAMTVSSQLSPNLVEPGVSHELAIWRAAHYSDVRYKINLTLEKMSPVLKGTIEIRVKVSEPPASAGGQNGGHDSIPIVLDWRKIRGSEQLSNISNVTINGTVAVLSSNFSWPAAGKEPAKAGTQNEYYESNEHLIFRDGVVAGENVIKLDFTSPILTSGSAITRYVDKEDGAEYIYSLFVPSDASTAFPVFDQPDLKARFTLEIKPPNGWTAVSNAKQQSVGTYGHFFPDGKYGQSYYHRFLETKPISSYVFAFATGPFQQFVEKYGESLDDLSAKDTFIENKGPIFHANNDSVVYVRRSQAAKFKPHAAEVFRLEREGIKYLETYFDYKFPWPKYDLVLIPEFPFGGMEHAGATFLKESSVIFPQEPTKNDYISRANLIFHETAHQWFGDTVTMKWFDDLWLKEGFAEFMAYKTLEKVMPEANAWKVFYERNKQAAYATDSTKGTTPIYQKIDNLSAAKSAYGNIVYRKAPSFLRQAEFFLGEDKFQTAVRAFLKKHEFGNAGWEDLVTEFGSASNNNLSAWANIWVKQQGLPTFRLCIGDYSRSVKFTGHPGEINLLFSQSGFPCDPVSNRTGNRPIWPEALQFYYILADGKTRIEKVTLGKNDREIEEIWGYNFGGRESKQTQKDLAAPKFVFTNYQDYGYGIFLLDDKSRDYVLKNIQNEKDPFLRSMMWGSLWDSVREAELDPKEYVELAIRNLSSTPTVKPAVPLKPGEQDESIITAIIGNVSTSMNYYFTDKSRAEISPRVESLLINRLFNAEDPGLAVTYYRAFVRIAQSEQARTELKRLLFSGGIEPRKNHTEKYTGVHLRTKDRFDIVTRLAILGDPEAPKLLSDLEKTETSDDAKRYAYAAHAAFATKENREKFWTDFVANKDISEAWIEGSLGAFNSIRHSDLTLPYLERALNELPNLKRNRKIFFVNGWLAAFIGGQRSEEALNVVNKFLADNPNLDKDLRLKVLENVDLIERAVKIRAKYSKP